MGTDMLKAKDGDFFVTDWLRNRNTLEFIGIWEKIYNPNFNYGEFATIRGQAGLNSFKIGVQEFVQRTHAICLCSKAGRYGGTYAHKDIAFEFAMWISAEFKIYIWLLRRGRPVRPPFDRIPGLAGFPFSARHRSAETSKAILFIPQILSSCPIGHGPAP